MRNSLKLICYNKTRKSSNLIEKLLFLIVITLLLTGINIVAGVLHGRLYGTPEAVLQFNSISEIIAISLRAAIFEEIIFRFIIISLVMYLQTKLFKISSNGMWLTSLIVSSLAFMFVHSTEAYLIAFVYGVLLGYTFMKYGLVEAMAVHFLIDVSTFTYFLLF